MGLVAIDVHGKLTAGSAPLASDARFSSRHCKGAPTMPFPLLKMARISTKSLSTPDTQTPATFCLRSLKADMGASKRLELARGAR
jgi:hypothetical protein